MIGARKTHRDARLKNSIALRNALLCAAVIGMVEGVRHGAYKFADGVARQLSVGIERDNVANTLQNGRSAYDARKVVSRLATQE